MDSLKVTDAESAAVAVAPRVSLQSMEDKIALRADFIVGEALDAMNAAFARDYPAHRSLEILSVCVITMENGFTVIGKSAPASPENFNAELGKKFAYEDAVRQLWPLEGYALREQLAKGA